GHERLGLDLGGDLIQDPTTCLVGQRRGDEGDVNGQHLPVALVDRNRAPIFVNLGSGEDDVVDGLRPDVDALDLEHVVPTGDGPRDEPREWSTAPTTSGRDVDCTILGPEADRWRRLSQEGR